MAFFYNKTKFLLIAGPCMLESEAVAFDVADVLKGLQAKHPELQVIFKSSFDKANRATFEGARGIGLEEGVRIFNKIKETFDLPLVTDVHSPEQCEILAPFCDILQIPAFLCRQTDLLLAAARTGRPVQVKKGQFLSPYEMEFVVDKLRKGGAPEVWQVDRGTTFGYQNLILDCRSFSIMKRWGSPVIFDSHCVQRPGTAKGSSSGDREFILPLAKAAVAAGANGIFIETHPSPAEALSDAATQIPLDEFPAFVKQCLSVWQVVREL
jgi:2-dehydro-3-deoxyphosphooctonate aldolase (KDO 8-P synthase)